MRNNIAFDLDGTLINFLSVFDDVLFHRYGAKRILMDRFAAVTDNNLSNEKISNAIDEAMSYISLLKPMPGAVAFVQQLYDMTGEPIKIITARRVKHAEITNDVIRRYFKVPYFLAMVNDYKDKLHYLKNIDNYVEDRRACAKFLAENGKNVYVPLRKYNKISGKTDNINFFIDFFALSLNLNKFTVR